MNSKKTDLQDVLFHCLVFNEAALVVVQPWITGFIQSILIYGLWAELILLTALVISRNASSIDKRFGWFVGIVVAFVCSMLLGNGSKGPAIVGFLEFFLTLLPYFWTNYMHYDNSHLTAIRVSTVVKGLFFILTSFTAKAYAPYISQGIAIYDGSLTLGYTNPNITGILIMNTAAVLLSMIRDRDADEGRFRRWIVILLSAYIFFLMYKTQSRIVIVCGALLLLAYFGRNLNFTRTVLANKWTIWIIILLPLVFLYGFYYLYHNNPNLMFLGAQVYLRTRIYDVVLASFEKNIWVGDVLTWYFQNSHNGLLVVLANIGIIGAIFYLFYMRSCIGRYADLVKSNENSNVLPYLMILIISIHSCVEAAMVSGGVQYAAEVAVICMLCERNRERQRVSS